MKYNEIGIVDVKKYLHVDYDDDDSLITILMSSASSYIETATKTKTENWDEIPSELTQVYLYLISLWYEQRVPVGKITNEINLTVSMLINPHNGGGVI